MKKHFYVQLIIKVSRRFVRAVPNMASSSNSESLIAKLVASLRYLREATVDIFGNIGVQDSYVSPLGEILLLYRSPKWLRGLENAGRGASKSGSTFKFGRTVTWELLGELESFYQSAHHDSAQVAFEVKVFHCWVRYRISTTEAYATHPWLGMCRYYWTPLSQEYHATNLDSGFMANSYKSCRLILYLNITSDLRSSWFVPNSLFLCCFLPVFCNVWEWLF